VQRLREVIGVLAGEDRLVQRRGLVAVGAVAGGADLRSLRFARFGISSGLSRRGQRRHQQCEQEPLHFAGTP
jgi:hypothetical protein